MRDFNFSVLELLQCWRERYFDFVCLCVQELGDIILGIILYWDIFSCDV